MTPVMMNLERLGFIHSLHKRALVAAEKYKSAEAELLSILSELDLEKGFRELGYSSLYTYATEALKLSEGRAYHFIQVARKSREVPGLTDAIKTGELNIGNARRIAPILTQDNKDEWIEKAKILPQAKLERELAKEFPKIPLKEVLSDYVERNDPLKKAVKTRLKTSSHAIRREVHKRDEGQCTARLPNGKRCTQRRWLHQHHKIHRFNGGKDTPQNLTTPCSAHHQANHHLH